MGNESQAPWLAPPWRQSSASESLPQSRWAGEAVGAKLISQAAVNYYPTLEELLLQCSWAFLVAQLVKNPSACNAGDLGLIPWLGRSPGEGKGYPLQYSGLKNSMDCSGQD